MNGGAMRVWNAGLGRAVADLPEKRPLPPRHAAMERWYLFLDGERSTAAQWLASGKLTQRAYSLRLDELGELEASLAVLAATTGGK